MATYLLEDHFDNNLSAGSVNGSLATDGANTRTVIDTNSKLSIASGQLTAITGGSGVGDPGLWYPNQSRFAGQMILSRFTLSSLIGFALGFDSNQSGGPSVFMNGSGSSLRISDTIQLVVGTLAASTVYTICVTLRSQGAIFLIRGGAFTNWSLLFLTTNNTSTSFYPVVQANGTTNAWTFDYIRMPSSAWLPTPLASDGFGSAFGSTDGLGHAEGIATGVGSGGNSVAWSQPAGAWSVSSSKAAASSLSSGIALATVSLSTADVLAMAKLTRIAGSVGVVVRYVDISNYVYCVHNGTNVLLVKRAGGTETTVATVAATYSAGAVLLVIGDGTAFRVYYNNVLITASTISDAGLQTGTDAGIYTTDTTNSIDDFVVYARGTSGEYANLARVAQTSTIVARSNTADAVLNLYKRVASAITAATNTSNVILNLRKRVASAITAATNTSNVILNLRKRVASAITAATNTSNVILNLRKRVASAITVTTNTASGALNKLMRVVSSIHVSTNTANGTLSVSAVINPTYRPKITFAGKRPYITFEVLE